MGLLGDIKDVGAAFWELGKVTKSWIHNADTTGFGDPGGRAPIAQVIDSAQMITAITTTVDTDGRNGAPSAAGQ